jgi:hypothetical protein
MKTIRFSFIDLRRYGGRDCGAVFGSTVSTHRSGAAQTRARRLSVDDLAKRLTNIGARDI